MIDRSFSVRIGRTGCAGVDRTVVAVVPGIGTLLSPVGGPAHEQHGGRQSQDRRRNAQPHLGYRRNPRQYTSRVSIHTTYFRPMNNNSNSNMMYYIILNDITNMIDQDK